MPFDESEEMTIGNIKSACERYFKTNLVCDILAGEQGPSCKTLSQMQDLKVVYVRFIPADMEAGGDADMTDTTIKRKISQRDAQSSTFKDFLPPKAKSSPSKMQSNQTLPACTRSTYYPRSLSISDMIMIHDHDHGHCEGYGFQAGG